VSPHNSASPPDNGYPVPSQRPPRSGAQVARPGCGPSIIEEIRECLRIGLQAANGSNQQSWALASSSPTPALTREDRRALPRGLSTQGSAGRCLSPPDGRPAPPRAGSLSSTEWLVENMAKVPLLVIPCYEPYLPAHRRWTSRFTRRRCTASIFPAVWKLPVWPCIPAAMAPASRRCTCTAKTRFDKLLGIPPNLLSRAVCCRSAACVPGQHLLPGRSATR